MTGAPDAVDRRLINALQGGFPVVPRPFAAVAEALGLDEDDVIGRIARLVEAGILSRFGPMLDAERLGGAVCLCALAVPPERFDVVAAMLADMPAVAHNYERRHALNMWFVLATETPQGIEAAARAVEAATGLAVARFPKEREYFIGMRVEA
ncbi:Lrp/AsnC family transcriptional regulator [Prosthecodimorpha staleyi]|uniref:siroheme decarboxylase n=1 Tax=Prosthecodimorpha staleyi TaxID=2840188 RepID=A0A947DAI5_9HYPH|nr:AsnC family transcriptional regulator [Prosthecodimorpha staleyi]MBT9293066.1 AsnC family transcriptional regulator [Prosthecodimorpha staleyi]